ncbi:MAG: DinB family protein [Saprospiraceae bacterium]|nr:DinB family protein [Saprospiraceae bacterium]
MNQDVSLILSVLNTTPQMIRSWLIQLPDDILLRSDRKDAWHTIDIVKHLIYGEQTDWIPRLQLMADHKEDRDPVTFVPFDRQGHKANQENDISILIKTFEDLRTENIKSLKDIAAQYDLENLKGIHPTLGLVTGKQMMSTWAVHDQSHIYQIARNITSSFVAHIGPWGEFMRIVYQNLQAGTK